MQDRDRLGTGSRGAEHKDKHIATGDTAIAENNFHHASNPALRGQGIGTLDVLKTQRGVTLSKTI